MTAMFQNGGMPFNQSMANRLIDIAGNDNVRNESHGTRLPVAWTVLYALTKLTDEQFADGINSGAINPNMQRKDVPPLKGCGWKNQIDAIQELLDLKAPEIAGKFRNAMGGGQGARNDLTEPTDIISKSGRSEGHGTSKSYTLDRLERDYPDLFERVIAGELSANAAAVNKAEARARELRLLESEAAE
jgi:hypothetical protein